MPHVQYRGRAIEYETHGDADAGRPPLLLVMGMGGSYRGWLPLQVPDFSKGRHVVLFNHRGVGTSEDDGKPFTTADLADDAIGLLDALGHPSVDVLGVFMGGMVAQEMALRHPARVRRLVLTGTYARPDAKRRILLEEWAASMQAGVPIASMVRKRMVWSLQDETLEQSDLIDSMVEFLTREGLPLSEDLFVRQCQACVVHDTADRLREIAAPTLVIAGRNDMLTPPKFHRELADEIPDARLVTLHYGGHLVMVESAERFNHTVLEFLDEA